MSFSLLTKAYELDKTNVIHVRTLKPSTPAYDGKMIKKKLKNKKKRWVNELLPNILRLGLKVILKRIRKHDELFGNDLKILMRVEIFF